MLIVDGKLRAVGPARRLENLIEARHADYINAAGCVVLPGFVDSHTHLVSGPARPADFEMRLAGATQEEIAEAGGGYPGILKAVQDRSIHTLEAQVSRLINGFVSEGTTTIEAKSGYGITEAGELKVLRVLAALQIKFGCLRPSVMAARSVPKEYDNRPDDYVDWLCTNLLPIVRRRKLAVFADFSCEAGVFTLDQARRYFLTARELGFQLKMHAEQNAHIGAIKLAVELGVVSVDQPDSLDAAHVGLLAQSSTIATLLPGPAFHLGKQNYPSARKLIDQGAAVALASGYDPQSCPTHNMQTIIALACARMNMTPAEAISAATINGACALSLSARVGSLEFEKDADLIILDVPDYREIPYHFGANLVKTTIMKGHVIYRAAEVKWPSN